MKLQTPFFFLVGSIAIATACGGTTTSGDTTGAGGDPSGSGTSGNTGSGASGSSTGSGSTGSGMSTPCMSSADCTLHSDCCNCLALGPGEQPPACDIPECLIDACGAIGGLKPGGAAACSGGQCIVGFDCNGADNTCDSNPPVCPPGQVPTADMCWGQCVDVAQCGEVTSCDDCDAATQVCASYVGWTTAKRCIPVPAACAQDRSCACLGTSVCTEGFNLCGNGMAPNEVTCECPTC